jgi:hypothetical protein
MDAAKKSPAELPAGVSELLYGMEAIARWLGITRGQVKPLIDAGVLPTFWPPGCAPPGGAGNDGYSSYRGFHN